MQSDCEFQIFTFRSEKIGSTSTPVPDTSVNSVRHQPGTATLSRQNKADSYAIRLRASDFYFSIWKLDRFSY